MWCDKEIYAQIYSFHQLETLKVLYKLDSPEVKEKYDDSRLMRIKNLAKRWIINIRMYSRIIKILSKSEKKINLGKLELFIRELKTENNIKKIASRDENSQNSTIKERGEIDELKKLTYLFDYALFHENNISSGNFIRIFELLRIKYKNNDDFFDDIINRVRTNEFLSIRQIKKEIEVSKENNSSDLPLSEVITDIMFFKKKLYGDYLSIDKIIDLINEISNYNLLIQIIRSCSEEYIIEIFKNQDDFYHFIDYCNNPELDDSIVRDCTILYRREEDEYFRNRSFNKDFCIWWDVEDDKLDTFLHELTEEQYDNSTIWKLMELELLLLEKYVNWLLDEQFLEELSVLEILTNLENNLNKSEEEEGCNIIKRIRSILERVNIDTEEDFWELGKKLEARLNEKKTSDFIKITEISWSPDRFYWRKDNPSSEPSFEDLEFEECEWENSPYCIEEEKTM